MTVSRREALIMGAAVPVSGLVLAPARGQASQQVSGGQGYGEDPILACCLLIDACKQIDFCQWTVDKAKNNDVKEFARSEVEHQQKLVADLQRLGYEYPTTPQFGNKPHQEGQFPQADKPAIATQAVTGFPQIGGTRSQGRTTAIAVGKLILPPGLSEMVVLAHDVAAQCLTNAKAILQKKGPEGKFDQSFIGLQLCEHYSSQAKCHVFDRHATNRLQKILQQERPIIERHIKKLEELMRKLD